MKGSEQKRFYAGHARYRGHDHPVVRRFVRSKLDHIWPILGLDAEDLCLEVGAGNGAFSAQLASRCNLVAMDIAPHALAANPAPQKVNADVDRLPFQDGQFACVFGFNVLHHVPCPDVALREMARVSGEWVVCLEPNCLNPLMGAFCLTARHERMGLQFRRTRMVELVRTVGLNVVLCSAFGGITQNLTPAFLAPVLRLLERPVPLGLYVLTVCRRT